MKKLNPGSEDYRKHENRITELKAKMEASKEQAEREITLRQAETMATLYKEIQAYAKWVAQHRGITHVMILPTPRPPAAIRTRSWPPSAARSSTPTRATTSPTTSSTTSTRAIRSSASRRTSPPRRASRSRRRPAAAGDQ